MVRRLRNPSAGPSPQSGAFASGGLSISADGAPGVRWSTLVGDDVANVDWDIETVVRALRAKHHSTRDAASAELVRRLSLAA